MRAAATARSSGSTVRARANASSRRILRPIVSPSTKSITKNDAPRTGSSSPHQRTRGTGTPADSAARRSSNSSRRLDSITCPGGSRRSTRRSGAAPSRTTVKGQSSRDARPGSRRSPSTATGVPSARPTKAARPDASSADVVEVLRPAVADAIAPTPLGEPFRDARRHAVSTIAERHHREHAAGDRLGRGTVGRMHPDADRGVELLVTREIGVDLDLAEIAVRCALLVDVAALDRAAVALHGARRGDTGAGTEVHREPAIVVGRLPVSRAPRAIAEPVAVDPPLGPVDDDATD